MRKIGFIPYKNTQKEILPKSYRVDQRHQQRKMLITMINAYLPEGARFKTSNNLQYHHTILEIFNERIFSFFQGYRWRPEQSKPVTHIYHYESQLFGQFFNLSQHPKARWLARTIPHKESFRMLLGYTHPVAQLMQLIFNGKQIQMTLDLDTLFAQTVYRRIKREPSKRITLDMPYIHINQHGVRTRIYPRWKQVDPKALERRHTDINDGLRQLHEENIDQYYLLYPKTDAFKRHIQVKNAHTDQLKMIPYSFTFSLKDKTPCKR